MTRVNSFNELGKEIEKEVQQEIKKFALSVWDEVVPKTPVWSGTLRYSWRLIPYIGGGQGNAGDTYKPDIIREEGHYGMPDRPDLEKYSNRWTNYILFNNQPYLERVIDLPQHGNWVEDGVNAAKAKFR